ALGAAAPAQPAKTTSEQVPAAWMSESPGARRWSALVDLRSFYDFTSGKGPPRPDWMGGELLGYFDLREGLSGAFVFRHEVRDQIGNYGTVMLIPRLAKNKYLVAAVSAGTAADFLPVTRVDLQLRAFFERWPHVMYDVGGYGTWWTSDRHQLAQSDALIF